MVSQVSDYRSGRLGSLTAYTPLPRSLFDVSGSDGAQLYDAGEYATYAVSSPSSNPLSRGKKSPVSGMTVASFFTTGSLSATVGDGVSVGQKEGEMKIERISSGQAESKSKSSSYASVGANETGSANLQQQSLEHHSAVGTANFMAPETIKHGIAAQYGQFLSTSVPVFNPLACQERLSS